MKIAVIGATGLVGGVMLKVLEERGFQKYELLVAASPKSVGKSVIFAGKPYVMQSVEDIIVQKPAIAIFSAGSTASLKYAPLFAEAGTTVIDNSSAWRMKEDVPLVVPEINAHLLTRDHKIISNPNCSTIQMVVALAPLHAKYTINRIIVSTYQSVTGTGIKAVTQMEHERRGIRSMRAYPHQIHRNLFPHGGDFLENGYTSEEMKLVHETRKIIGDNSLRITSTVVRVPVTGGHSEAVNLEFKHDFDLTEVKELLANSPGIKVLDNPANNEYPMPLFAEGKDDVFVGRIRRDESNERSLNLWIVSDNLRKGAATNAVQIAQYLIAHKLVK